MRALTLHCLLHLGSVRACVLVSLTVIFFAFGGWRPAHAQNENSAHVQLEVRDGRVTLEVRDAPVTDVIHAIGEEAGFSTVVRGVVDIRTTRSFIETPIEEAVRRLARGTTLVMIYAPRASDTELRPIKEVRLYSSTPGEFVSSRLSPDAEALDPELLVGLSQDDIQARIHALQSLGDLKDPSVVAIVSDMLSGDEHAAVRGQAAAVLGRIGSEDAIPALRSALGDSNQAVRVQVVRALGNIGGERVAGILGNLLMKDADQRVRTTAAWSLGNLKTEMARSYLQAAAPEADEIVRRSIDQNLERWNESKGENP